MIRFICRPTDLALACMKAFAEEGIIVRVLPHGAIHFGVLPQWREFEASFMTPIENDYVNVVCVEDADDFKKLCTVGVPNIAVTADIAVGYPYDRCVSNPAGLIGALKEYGW